MLSHIRFLDKEKKIIMQTGEHTPYTNIENFVHNIKLRKGDRIVGVKSLASTEEPAVHFWFQLVIKGK